MATVLVVDDLPANRDLVQTVLGYYGHETLAADDGAQALALLTRQHPDLVLTDVAMPGMDGYQLARAIRSDPDCWGIPILFYTANYLEKATDPSADTHGVSHIHIAPKNGDLAALIEAVQDTLLEAS
jgi:CheY-like chemotaxis protein